MVDSKVDSNFIVHITICSISKSIMSMVGLFLETESKLDLLSIKSTCPRYFDNPPDTIEDRTQSILNVLEEGEEVKKRE